MHPCHPTSERNLCRAPHVCLSRALYIQGQPTRHEPRATAKNRGGSPMTKSRKRKRVHRVARGKPKPGHIVAHNRRRRKGEILCHNHVLHTAATANGVHGFHWFTVCAPAGWDPASEEWEVCPCGWRPKLRKHYAKASHVQWWREQIKERGSLEAAYREIRRRQREYRDTDVG